MGTLEMLLFLVFAFFMGAIIAAAVVMEWVEIEKHKETEGKSNEND